VLIEIHRIHNKKSASVLFHVVKSKAYADLFGNV